MNVDPQVDSMTRDQAGCSQAALDSARAIMRLDGLAVLRQSLEHGSYDQAAMVAHWARMIDVEFRAVREELAKHRRLVRSF